MMEEDRKLPAWALPVLGVITVVVLVVIGLNRAPSQFDPDSPEAAVQAYLNALVEGDWDTASSYWAEGDCVPESETPTMSVEVAAVLVGVDRHDEEATVRVRLTETSNDPLEGIYEREEWFTVVREAGEWRIQQPSWPYYDQMCEAVG